MDDFKDFMGKALMAQDGKKKLEIITDVFKNKTVYAVTDTDGMVHEYNTPQKAIATYNSIK